MDKQLKRRHDNATMATIFGGFALIIWFYGIYARQMQEFNIKYQAAVGEPSKHNLSSDSLFLQYDPQWFLYSGIALVGIGVAYLVHTKSLVKKAQLVSESGK